MTYTTIYQSDRATAEALLVAAEELGLEAHEVRTVTGGFLVPDAVAGRFEEMKAGKTKPVAVEEGPSEDAPQEAPDKSWKVADIRAYAEEHNIDLGDATKKDDLLAAISADTKEE